MLPPQLPRSESSSDGRVLSQVVSGGQTGVDRAALDAAMSLGLPVGGWCPRGRRAEDGRVPDVYPVKETAARSYAVRTEWNVRDSDGTLVVVLDDVRGGTQLTLEVARRLQKPRQVVHLNPASDPGLLPAEISWEEQISAVVDWIHTNRIRVLNVAGPRGSSASEVYRTSRDFLDRLLKVVTTADR